MHTLGYKVQSLPGSLHSMQRGRSYLFFLPILVFKRYSQVPRLLDTRYLATGSAKKIELWTPLALLTSWL